MIKPCVCPECGEPLVIAKYFIHEYAVNPRTGAIGKRSISERVGREASIVIACSKQCGWRQETEEDITNVRAYLEEESK